MVRSSGRGNALPQWEQHGATAEFSTPHEGHFMIEGWLIYSHPEDYPARQLGRQEVSSRDAPRYSMIAYFRGESEAASGLDGARRLPTSAGASVNGHASSGKFRKQFDDSGRDFPVTLNDHSPFQILAEFLVTEVPFAKGRRLGFANLDEREVSSQSQGILFVRQKSAEDEMIVAVYENADHVAPKTRFASSDYSA
jgi:hypothetical protein